LTGVLKQQRRKTVETFRAWLEMNIDDKKLGFTSDQLDRLKTRGAIVITAHENEGLFDKASDFYTDQASTVNNLATIGQRVMIGSPGSGKLGTWTKDGKEVQGKVYSTGEPTHIIIVPESDKFVKL